MHVPAAPASLHGRVRGGSWFSGLPCELQEALLQMGRPRRLAPGQRLFGRGDAPDGIYCVIEGALRISNSSSDGKEALLTFIEPPHWIGEITLFDGQLRTHDAVAETPVEVFHLPQQALLDLLARHPAWWRDVALLLTQKLRMTFLLVEETALLPAAGRVARRLVAMAEGYGEWKDRSRRMLVVSQEQLALMLALSRQTVNQILKQFEAQGVVGLVRGGVEIIDMDKLRSLAG
jgi:CRP/FNR family cyclic AMP-dependent transcriptional regulator